VRRPSSGPVRLRDCVRAAHASSERPGNQPPVHCCACEKNHAQLVGHHQSEAHARQHRGCLVSSAQLPRLGDAHVARQRACVYPHHSTTHDTTTKPLSTRCLCCLLALLLLLLLLPCLPSSRGRVCCCPARRRTCCACSPCRMHDRQRTAGASPTRHAHHTDDTWCCKAAVSSRQRPHAAAAPGGRAVARPLVAVPVSAAVALALPAPVPPPAIVPLPLPPPVLSLAVVLARRAPAVVAAPHAAAAAAVALGRRHAPVVARRPPVVIARRPARLATPGAVACGGGAQGHTQRRVSAPAVAARMACVVARTGRALAQQW
jgi:hypothetical protein